MVAHGRVELLAHPLSQKYLQMKWNSYGKYFHLANLLFYSVFLFFVTLFTSQLMRNATPIGHADGNVRNRETETEKLSQFRGRLRFKTY